MSRLLARFDVPNRAGLIARTLSDALSRSVTFASMRTTDLALSPEVVVELEAYQVCPFYIGLTLGRDNLLVFVNHAGGSSFGISAEGRTTASYATRRASPGTNVFREGANAAFRTGLPTTVEGGPARWLRDDGTWATGTFTCLLQPMRNTAKEMLGILWICTAVQDPAQA